MLRARVTGVQGREVSLENYEDVRGRGSLAREYTMTYRPALERNETVIAGTFWDATPSAEGEVSIEESLRERFRINIGDTMRFDVMGRRSRGARDQRPARRVVRQPRRRIHVRVPSRAARPGAARIHLVLSRPAGRCGRAPGCRARSSRDFPNVSVIDGREMLTTIRTVIDNVTLAVTVVGSLVVLSGLLILIGAVAMTKFRRIYEAAIFKTLGATRRTIASVLLLEYGVLGALAGTIGSVGAIALTWGISRFALDIPWRPLPLVSATRHRRQRGARGGRRRRGVVGSAAAQAAGDAARRVGARQAVDGML